MSKTLLILAASTYQIPAIKAAKQAGYRVLVTDNNPANPGHAFADASFQVDTTDLHGILKLAISENISGIIAPATDIAVMSAANVCEQLNLPGYTLAAATVLTHKHNFRAFLSKAGLPCPRAFAVTEDRLPADGLFKDGRWLIKPSRASGSKGVFIVHSEAEFQARVAVSRAFSLDGTAILEEYIEGTQHTCEGILQDGKIALSLLTDRDTVAPPYTTTKGHRIPSRLPDYLQAKALATINQVLKHFDINNGPFDCDFVTCGENIFLIEISPRLGGNSLSRLFKASLNFDLVTYAVTNACGDVFPIPTPQPPQATAIIILGVEQSGRLNWDKAEAEALRQESWVNHLLIDLPLGSSVQAFINGRHRVGEALLSGTDRNDIDAKILEFSRRLALTAV